MSTPMLRFKDENGDTYPEWEYIPLATVFETRNGYTPTKANSSFWENGTIPWFRMEDIRANGRILYDAIQHVSEEAVKKSGLLPPQTVFFATSATVGEHAILMNGGLTNQRFTAIIPKEEYAKRIVPMYIQYIGYDIDNYCLQNQIVSTMPSVNMAMFNNYSFPIPALPEQQKIADFLSAVDEVIRAAAEDVRLWEERKRGVMQKLFSQEVRFKDENGDEYPEWEEESIGSIGTFFGGLSGKSKEDFGHGDGLYIPYRNVYTNAYTDVNYLERVNIREGEKQRTIAYGDVLFTQSSETVEEVGMSSVWLHDETPYMNSFCMALRPYDLNRTIPEYLGQMLRSPNVRKRISEQGQGFSRINLSAKRLGTVIIPIPCKGEQQKIADALTAIDEVITLKKQKLHHWQQLKKGLLQQMFV